MLLSLYACACVLCGEGKKVVIRDGSTDGSDSFDDTEITETKIHRDARVICVFSVPPKVYRYDNNAIGGESASAPQDLVAYAPTSLSSFAERQTALAV
jgi:hypothetical protein